MPKNDEKMAIFAPLRKTKEKNTKIVNFDKPLDSNTAKCYNFIE